MNFILFIFLFIAINAEARNTFYSSDEKEGSIIILTDVSGQCEAGWGKAYKKRISDKKFYDGSYCFTVDKNNKYVTVKDSTKYLFNTHKYLTSSFVKILTQEEQRARDMEQFGAKLRGSIESQSIVGQDTQRGIQHLLINGEPALCTRVGNLLSCD